MHAMEWLDRLTWSGSAGRAARLCQGKVGWSFGVAFCALLLSAAPANAGRGWLLETTTDPLLDEEITRAVTGQTAKHFIDERVILEIKRLLAQGRLSVKEIAYAAGFDEPTNMAKFFRKYTGRSPGAFAADPLSS